MQENFFLDKEVIYSYDAGEDLYFLRGFEEAISIYYREYETSNQVGSIIKDNPKYQSVKFLLKKNGINFKEEDYGIWFAFKPKVLEIKSLQENNETTPLDKIEMGVFAPFNLYWKGRIYRLFQFSSNSEKSVSDRLIFMNSVINSQMIPTYFKIDYYGEARGIRDFIKSYGGNIKIKNMEIEFDSDCEIEKGLVKITLGKSGRFDIITEKGLISYDGRSEISELINGINRAWESIHKAPLEMMIQKKDHTCSLFLRMEEDYMNTFLLQIKKTKVENLRIVHSQSLQY